MVDFLIIMLSWSQFHRGYNYATKVHLRNEFNFRNVHGIMNTSDLMQSKWNTKRASLTLQETRIIHDSMNIPKIEFIAYIYILL